MIFSESILKTQLKQFVFIALMVLYGVNARAQENDFQIWGDVSAQYKINKKIRLNAEVGLRSRENTTLLKQYYADLGGKYELNKRWSIGAKYRFIDYYRIGKTSIHRANIDVYYRFKKWGRFRLSIRERYQHQWYFSDYNQRFDEQTLRSRFDISYNIRKSKIQPAFSFEHYWGLSGRYQFLSTQLRWTLGAKIPVSKWSDLVVSYRLEKEIYRSQPQMNYIFLLSYQVDLN